MSDPMTEADKMCDEEVGKELMDECRKMIKGWRRDVEESRDFSNVAAKLAMTSKGVAKKEDTVPILDIVSYMKRNYSAMLLANLNAVLNELERMVAEARVTDPEKKSTPVEQFLLEQLSSLHMFAFSSACFAIDNYFRYCTEKMQDQQIAFVTRFGPEN